MERVERVSYKSKALRALWSVVYLLFFRPFGTRLFRIYRLCILKAFGAKVTWKSSVYASTKIWAPWNLEMDDYAGIGPNVIVYNQALVKIGKNAKISQFCFLCTAGHDISELNSANSGLIVGSITLCDKSWIGAKSYIGMDVTIGEGAVVGATSSVYKDVEPWTVVGGNPAKFIKTRTLKD